MNFSRRGGGWPAGASGVRSAHSSGGRPVSARSSILVSLRRRHGPRLIAERTPAEPLFEISSGWYWILLSATFGLSLASQIGLYLRGLYTISSDESERTLLAYKLTLAKAVEPFLWPPLPKILTGLALKLHPDLVATPRILVAATGLLTLGAIVILTRRLFDNRLVALVAGALAVFIPQRLILSVVPMADIFGYLFVLIAAAFLINWLRQGRVDALIYASLCLLLAATVRFEDWFFNGVLIIYLAYRTFVSRDLRASVFVLSGALLMAFPCAWVIATYVHDGSLTALSLTSHQFIASHGHDWNLALNDNVILYMVKDTVVSFVFLIGILSLVYFAARNSDIRAWALVLFTPLVLLGASMLVTFSVPMAAPFRTDGTWLLLLVPFAAWVIVSLAQRISTKTLGRLLAVVLMTFACIVPLALRSRTYVQEALSQTGAVANKPLGSQLHALLRANNRRILLDAIDNLDYLDVLVLSNAPDRFVLNVDADPTHVAVYASQRQYYLRHDDVKIVKRYLTDKFAITSGLNLDVLRARKISYMLVRNNAYIKALDANPDVTRMKRFGPWVLFTIRGSR